MPGCWKTSKPAIWAVAVAAKARRAVVVNCMVTVWKLARKATKVKCSDRWRKERKSKPETGKDE